MENPLVSVICLCYNHERYVAEALLSVLNQTYEPVELIVIDDASSDGSVSVIQKIVNDLSNVKFLQLTENMGNCRAFNQGLALANGDYIIDLSADDVLVKTRIEKGVQAFSTHSKDYGVNFTDAMYIDEYSNITGYHYERDNYGSLTHSVPEGDVYRHLLERYYICTPTMMIKKEVFKALHGYDEELAYEDFDFWIRSSRRFRYIYTDDILVRKRTLDQSLSKFHYKDKDFIASTLRVCQKALELNDGPQEEKALLKRVKYEMRQAILYNQYGIAEEFYQLFRKLKPGMVFKGLFWLGIKLHLNLKFITLFQSH